jgi:hypothetical protein
MRSIEVEFPSGRELLSSYWGFLHHGGLVLEDRDDLTEGEDILVNVRIRSLKQSYQLTGRVLRKSSGEDRRTIIAFAADQDQEMMLNAAWADSHDTPQRKHRRFPIDREVSYTPADAPDKSTRGYLLNVSPGGCRLNGPTVLQPGARVQVDAQGIAFAGQVRWSSPGGDMGIEFSRSDLPVQKLLGGSTTAKS